MKSFLAFIIAALVLAVIGAACLGVAHLENSMADAQQRVSTLQYQDAKTSLDDAKQYADHARWVPWLGHDERQEIKAREAAVQYWEKKYDAIVPAQAEPVAAVGDESVELQLVVANGEYRLGQMESKDKASTMKALDQAAAGYLTVLKNNTWHPDAAYNYEYLLRLRGDIAQGKRKPTSSQDKSDNLGEQGAPAQNSANSKKFEIYVPLEGSERTESGEAGKGAPIKKKG